MLLLAKGFLRVLCVSVVKIICASVVEKYLHRRVDADRCAPALDGDVGAVHDFDGIQRQGAVVSRRQIRLLPDAIGIPDACAVTP